MKNKFKEGDRVKLLANKKEGWDEARGAIFGESGKNVYLVELDAEYREGFQEDGLREIDSKNIVRE